MSLQIEHATLYSFGKRDNAAVFSVLTLLVQISVVVRCAWSVILRLGFEAQAVLELERQVASFPSRLTVVSAPKIKQSVSASWC